MMKTLILKISAIGFVMMLFLVASVSTGCKKDKTCHGKVKVVDTNGVAVGSANVKLSAPSVNGDVVYQSTTDGSGEVTFDVKLPAIFDVYATKPSVYPLPMAGVGVLRLDEPGKSDDVTVKIQ
ncbi:MAG: hypothetical protein ACJ77K_13410 [Bacteroidia bacterium]